MNIDWNQVFNGRGVINLTAAANPLGIPNRIITALLDVLTKNRILGAGNSIKFVHKSKFTSLKGEQILSNFNDLGFKLIYEGTEEVYSIPVLEHKNYFIIKDSIFIVFSVDPVDLEEKNPTPQFTFRILTDLSTEDLAALIEKITSWTCPKKIKQVRNKIHAIIATEDGLVLKDMGEGGLPLVRENYTPEAIEGFDHIVSDLCVEDPCGKLVILEGPTGTGKTHYLRGIIESVEARFVLLSSEVFARLQGPELPNLFKKTNDLNKDQKKPTVLIIEDGDGILVRRCADNISNIATLLNACSGIFGNLLNLRVIVTTNARKIDIDPAIIRAGRLCQHVSIGLLQPQHAMEILKKLAPTRKFDIKEEISLADVYKLARELKGTSAPTKSKTTGFVR